MNVDIQGVWDRVAFFILFETLAGEASSVLSPYLCTRASIIASLNPAN
jgi:hypothetical protein